jgi:hypothetical protein
MHPHCVGPDHRLSETTATKHNLFIIGQLISRPNKSLLHGLDASDRRSAPKINERISAFAIGQHARECRPLRSRYCAHDMCGTPGADADRNAGTVRLLCESWIANIERPGGGLSDARLRS